MANFRASFPDMVSGSLYVPRRGMPQVHSRDYPALIRFAREQGVCVVQDCADPRCLKYRQRVVWNPAKYRPETNTKPVLVSRDGFILDGNHRVFAARMERKAIIPIVLFSLPFDAAIAMLQRFAGTYESNANPNE